MTIDDDDDDMVRTATVHGLTLAYREAGEGRPIVLLHGNPTSSYLWRHVLPRLATHGHVIAPDLPGMGASQKLPTPGPGSYRYTEQRRYLDALLAALEVRDDVVLVGHDWGGVLAIDWARRHTAAVGGLAYMETIVRPRHWYEEPEDGRRFFRALRSEQGEHMVLRDNVFIEQVLASAVLGGLAPADLAAYREPFRDAGESRRAMLTWAREIPFDGSPSDVHEIVAANAAWLATSVTPKLFVSAEPGAIITGDTREFCRALPNQREVVVHASHFVPEDAPGPLADALGAWLTELA